MILTLGAIDKRNVDMFKILDRRIVNDRAGSEAHGAIKERKRTAAMEVRDRFKLTDHKAAWQGGPRRGGLLRCPKCCPD